MRIMSSTLLLLLSTISLLLCADTKVYQLFTLSRHGARYHVQSFYDGDDTKPLWAELTAVGMRQNQRLGQLIRKQYVNALGFLSDKYNSSQIQIYTTHTNRTFQSAQSLFYGVYPPSTGPRITYVDKQLRLPPYSNKTDIEQQNFALPSAYQPIKVKNNEKVILTDCPNYDIYEAENFGKISDTLKQMNTTYYPFMKRMSILFNFTLQNATFLQLVRCYDAAVVDLFLGRPWPNGFTQDDFKNVEHFANWYYYVAMGNNNSLMVNTFKFQKLINTFDLRTRLPETYALKWTHLSGHDTDILAMHLALNISSAECTEQLFRKGSTKAVECEQGGVSFAANVIIQLHSNNAKDFFIKVRSNGKYMKICSKATYQCDYTEFKSLIRKSMTSKNMDDFCGYPIKQFYRKVEHNRKVDKIKQNMDRVEKYLEYL